MSGLSQCIDVKVGLLRDLLSFPYHISMSVRSLTIIYFSQSSSWLQMHANSLEIVTRMYTLNPRWSSYLVQSQEHHKHLGICLLQLDPVLSHFGVLIQTTTQSATHLSLLCMLGKGYKTPQSCKLTWYRWPWCSSHTQKAGPGDRNGVDMH